MWSSKSIGIPAAGLPEDNAPPEVADPLIRAAEAVPILVVKNPGSEKRSYPIADDFPVSACYCSR
ncbi:hypothetical protein GCM10009413_30320 [Tatumella punctata]